MFVENRNWIRAGEKANKITKRQSFKNKGDITERSGHLDDVVNLIDKVLLGDGVRIDPLLGTGDGIVGHRADGQKLEM